MFIKDLFENENELINFNSFFNPEYIKACCIKHLFDHPTERERKGLEIQGFNCSLFENLRFSRMIPKYFANWIKFNPIVIRTEEINQFIYNVSFSIVSEDLRKEIYEILKHPGGEFISPDEVEALIEAYSSYYDRNFKQMISYKFRQMGFEQIDDLIIHKGWEYTKGIFSYGDYVTTFTFFESEE